MLGLSHPLPVSCRALDLHFHFLFPTGHLQNGLQLCVDQVPSPGLLWAAGPAGPHTRVSIVTYLFALLGNALVTTGDADPGLHTALYFLL